VVVVVVVAVVVVVVGSFLIRIQKKVNPAPGRTKRS
jgi:hypothetical protein